LMQAASMDRAAVVELLLKRGADPGRRDQMGRTALDRAREAGNQDVVDLLKRAAPATPDN